jgi:hypothetical protein
MVEQCWIAYASAPKGKLPVTNRAKDSIAIVIGYELKRGATTSGRLNSISTRNCRPNAAIEALPRARRSVTQPQKRHPISHPEERNP